RTTRRLTLHALVAGAQRYVERTRRLRTGVDDRPRRAMLRHDEAEALERRACALPSTEPIDPAEHLPPLVRRDRAARDPALCVAEHELHVRLARIDPGKRPGSEPPLDLEVGAPPSRSGDGEGLRAAAVWVLGVDQAVAVIVHA